MRVHAGFSIPCRIIAVNEWVIFYLFSKITLKLVSRKP
jgi:hypothetical protein